MNLAGVWLLGSAALAARLVMLPLPLSYPGNVHRDGANLFERFPYVTAKERLKGWNPSTSSFSSLALICSKRFTASDE